MVAAINWLSPGGPTEPNVEPKGYQALTGERPVQNDPLSSPTAKESLNNA
jgi:hypothetical protein